MKDSPLDDELPETAPLLSLEDANRVAPEYVSDVECRELIGRWDTFFFISLILRPQ